MALDTAAVPGTCCEWAKRKRETKVRVSILKVIVGRRVGDVDGGGGGWIDEMGNVVLLDMRFYTFAALCAKVDIAHTVSISVAATKWKK